MTKVRDANEVRQSLTKLEKSNMTVGPGRSRGREGVTENQPGTDRVAPPRVWCWVLTLAPHRPPPNLFTHVATRCLDPHAPCRASSHTTRHPVPLVRRAAPSLARSSPAITTTTFFRGDPGGALTLLTERLRLMVEANPWLAGTLMNGNTGLELAYPGTFDEDSVAPMINPTRLRGKPCSKRVVLDNTMDYVSVCKAVLKTAAEVPPGRFCKNKPFPQLALSVVPDAKEPGGYTIFY